MMLQVIREPVVAFSGSPAGTDAAKKKPNSIAR
jgi:hypothetical protein